jgi:aminoglycoside phosphotransferase (APT) family kinase protein
MKEHWNRASAYLHLDSRTLTQLIQPAFPGRTVESGEIVTGGLSSTIYRVVISGEDRSFALRCYTRDGAACRKDLDLFRLIHGRVPIPAIYFADPNTTRFPTPYAITEWIEGITLRELLLRGDASAIGQAAYAVGAVRGTMSQFAFPQTGLFGPGLTIAQPLDVSAAGFESQIAWFLGERGAGERLGESLSQRLLAYVRRYAPLLDAVSQRATLTHADFNPPNILMSHANDSWRVAAVIDWEFAWSGPPLYDLGIMLRDSQRLPPIFAERLMAGFADHGGEMPTQWLRIARMLDLINLCDFLVRPDPDSRTVADVTALIEQTVADQA